MKIDELKWRRFEQLVAAISAKLHPNAIVEHDVHLTGASGVQRQIDVAIWSNASKSDLLLLIDCKDYDIERGNIGIKTVDEFIGTVIDFDTHLAALVTFSDFTPDAKKRAAAAGIKLWRAADTGDHDWHASLTIPVLTRSVRMQSSSFAFTESSTSPFSMKRVSDMRELPLYDRNGKPMGSIGHKLMKAWNDGKLPDQPGRHDRIAFIDEPTMVEGGDAKFYFVSISASITVVESCHLIHLGIEELSGFYDLQNGDMMTRGFTTKSLNVERIEQDGERIDDPDNLAIKPFMMIGFVDHFRLE